MKMNLIKICSVTGDSIRFCPSKTPIKDKTDIKNLKYKYFCYNFTNSNVNSL